MRIVATCLIFAGGLAAAAAATSALGQSAPAAKEDPLATCQARVQADDRFVSESEEKLDACTAKLNANPQVAAANADALKSLERQLDGLFDRIDTAVQRLSAEQP